MIGVDSPRRLRVFRARFAQLEGVGLADCTDRLPACSCARALRPVPRRGGGRQRRHLHRSLGPVGPHAGLLPHRCGRRRAHRDRGVRRADAGAREGQGHRADHRIALQRQQSRRAAVDPHHRLAFGAQVLRALRAGPLSQGRGGPVLGGVAHRRRAADLQARPTSPASRDEVRQYFADVRGTALHVRTRRQGDALPVVHAARPRRAAMGGQPGAGARGHRDPAEMDAAHGQFRPACRGRRRGGADRTGVGPGVVDQQLSADARRCSPHRSGAPPTCWRFISLRRRLHARRPSHRPKRANG